MQKKIISGNPQFTAFLECLPPTLRGPIDLDTFYKVHAQYPELFESIEDSHPARINFRPSITYDQIRSRISRPDYANDLLYKAWIQSYQHLASAPIISKTFWINLFRNGLRSVPSCLVDYMMFSLGREEIYGSCSYLYQNLPIITAIGGPAAQRLLNSIQDGRVSADFRADIVATVLAALIHQRIHLIEDQTNVFRQRIAFFRSGDPWLHVESFYYADIKKTDVSFYLRLNFLLDLLADIKQGHFERTDRFRALLDAELPSHSPWPEHLQIQTSPG